MNTREPVAQTTSGSATNLRPAEMGLPSYVMCPPLSYATTVANNPWMEEYEPEEREPNQRLALAQFFQLYRYIASEGVVYLVPTPPQADLQDQVFAANLAVTLEHEGHRGTIILSNFTSEPRRGETDVGLPFFRLFGDNVHVAPSKFEGDAELKHLHDNVYVGGYGIRSEPETYDWMERTFDMRVIKVRLKDPYLYHLDCLVFPVTREQTVACTELLSKEEVEALERETDIIDVSAEESYAGICNSLRLTNMILSASNIHELDRKSEDYTHEVKKNRRLEDIASELAMEVKYFNLSEYLKGGALLSCMVMHLNRFSYEFQLT
ncbi:MAG TPA: arginine deiminase-related protein [Actinomycetota bacterium]|nr:arginine deiminase-related protein [Actinomycetota bacterium]